MRILAADLRDEATVGLTKEEQDNFIVILTKIKNNLINMAELPNNENKTRELNNIREQR